MLMIIVEFLAPTDKIPIMCMNKKNVFVLNKRGTDVMLLCE